MMRSPICTLPRERMLAKFNATYVPVTETGCWLWTGYWNRDGYGRMYAGAQILAHQASAISNELVRTQAIRYGVSKATISMIRTGRNWRHAE